MFEAWSNVIQWNMFCKRALKHSKLMVISEISSALRIKMFRFFLKPLRIICNPLNAVWLSSLMGTFSFLITRVLDLYIECHNSEHVEAENAISMQHSIMDGWIVDLVMTYHIIQRIPFISCNPNCLSTSSFFSLPSASPPPIPCWISQHSSCCSDD